MWGPLRPKQDIPAKALGIPDYAEEIPFGVASAGRSLRAPSEVPRSSVMFRGPTNRDVKWVLDSSRCDINNALRLLVCSSLMYSLLNLKDLNMRKLGITVGLVKA